MPPHLLCPHRLFVPYDEYCLVIGIHRHTLPSLTRLDRRSFTTRAATDSVCSARERFATSLTVDDDI